MRIVTPCIRLTMITLLPGVIWLALCTGMLSAAIWQDLTVNVNSDWAGCGNGGYFPVRVSLANRGAARSVTLTYKGMDLPPVSRTVDIASPGGSPQAIKMEVTLLVPCVADSTWGMLNVAVNGRSIPELSDTSVSLSDSRGYQETGPAVLVTSSTSVDLANLKSAVNALLNPGSSSYYSTVAEDHAFVNTSSLPSEWQAYTGLDILTIDEPSLKGLTPDVRTAIMKWVDTGGNLVVTKVTSAQEQQDPESPAIKQLETLLGLNATAELQTWQQLHDIAHFNSIRSQFEMTLQEEANENGLNVEDESPQREYQSVNDFVNRTFNLTLSGRQKLGLVRERLRGKVYAIHWDLFETLPGAAAPASHAPWMLIINSIGKDHWDWTHRHGISARRGNSTFMNFPVPSVQGVPVAAFLVLITLFSIMIGPINYFYLLKQKRLYLLVLTIPAIAVLTSVSLFAYSAVAHGFRTRSRVRSVTVIDQSTNRAMVSSRVSLYSGLAPGGGLNFSKDSAVFPIWASSDDRNAGEVNWTDVQNFGSGWLRSRTRTQFLVTTQRDERGRLDIRKEGNQLVVANGFEFDLELLTIADENGQLYFTTTLAAGDTARLSEMTSADHRPTFARLVESPLQPPPGYRGYSRRGRYDRYGNYQDYEEDAGEYTNSVQERDWEGVKQFLQNPSQHRRQYSAFAATNPGIDIGMTSTTEEASSHLILGHY